MNISKVQRALVLAGAVSIVVFSAVPLIEGESLGYSLQQGLENSLGFLVLLGLLFVASFGIPDEKWPWSKERQASKLKTESARELVLGDPNISRAEIKELVRIEKALAGVKKSRGGRANEALKSTITVSDKIHKLARKHLPTNTNRKHKFKTPGNAPDSTPSFLSIGKEFLELSLYLDALEMSYRLHFVNLKILSKPKFRPPIEDKSPDFFEFRQMMIPILQARIDLLSKKAAEAFDKTDQSSEWEEINRIPDAEQMLKVADEARSEFEQTGDFTKLTDPVLKSPTIVSLKSRQVLVEPLFQIVQERFSKSLDLNF
jgi:hypothetical protein